VTPRALVILGNGGARIQRRLVVAAERIARLVQPQIVVFSGWEGEAERMRELWSGPDVELVLEEHAETTAQNAARTLPLLQERGVTQAIVVCAPTHLPRTRWIFRRIYGRHGIDVRFAVARVLPTPGALVWELAAVAVAARQVRAELERK
jgi:uncharacterized SAM-binding protein YcdF (DUF218 family)